MSLAFAIDIARHDLRMHMQDCPNCDLTTDEAGEFCQKGLALAQHLQGLEDATGEDAGYHAQEGELEQ